MQALFQKQWGSRDLTSPVGELYLVVRALGSPIPGQARIVLPAFHVLAGTLQVLRFCELCWGPGLRRGCLGRCCDLAWSQYRQGSACPTWYLVPTAVQLAWSRRNPSWRSNVLAAGMGPNPLASFPLPLSHSAAYQFL